MVGRMAELVDAKLQRPRLALRQSTVFAEKARPGASGGWLKAEFAVFFLAAPLMATAAGGVAGAIAALASIFWASVILLSLTRNFHWSDLTPKDILTEWRLAVFGAVGAVVAPVSLFALLAHGPATAEGAHSPARLLFLIAAAPTLELFCRALFVRRYGALFRSARSGVIAAAAVGALVYLAIGAGPSGAAFGALAGIALTVVYLKTGQFLLPVFLHLVAAPSFWLLAPALMAA